MNFEENELTKGISMQTQATFCRQDIGYILYSYAQSENTPVSSLLSI